MIDAKIEIVANKHPISVGVKGKTSAPKVSVDAGDILKNEAKKAVGEKLDGLLKGFF